MTDEPAAHESNWHKATVADGSGLSIRAPGHGLSVDELLEQRVALIDYLWAKVKAGDWHAVQDAASDIREINAKLEVLRG